jgi:hypothetical protein
MFMGWIWIGHLKHSSWIDHEASIRPYLCAGYFGGETPLATFVEGTILKWIR